MIPPVILSHPTANVFSLALAEHLAASGTLDSFWTSLVWDKTSHAGKFMPRKLRAQLERRAVSPRLRRLVHTHPSREIGRLFLQRLGLNMLHRHSRSPFSTQAVYTSLDRRVADWILKHPSPGVVYAYEDGAATSFHAAAQTGRFRVYDLPIAYWELRKSIYDTEAQRYPDWKETLQGADDSPYKLARKTQEALDADLIVCPSDFVKDSIVQSKVGAKPIAVVPFGSPLSCQDPNPASPDIGGPLRVLFVASLSQRKGLADLFEAIKLLPKNSISFQVIGSLLKPLKFYLSRCPTMDYLGTMPRTAVLDAMRHSDVLVLPSLAEGRALVIQEALSQGLPVIVTPNTGVSDLMIDGENGFTVPIRSPQYIADRLNWFCENRNGIPAMRMRSVDSVRNLSWDRYASGIVNSIENHMPRSCRD
ncbi:MAG: glycosyltransferase family 4 protein [Opitutales bacterium]|nr:glycosyltransferase family 4 protein [Opitutales bacterium]